MKLVRAGLSLVIAGLVVVTTTALPAAANPLAGREDYERRVQPLLAKYCYDCHADGVSKGDFALDRHTTYANLRADHAVWEKVRLQVVCHVMPPLKKPQPTADERAAIVRWIDESVFYCDPQRPDPGPVVLRRLNRAEYNNTVRDLFFVAVRPADQFPPDDAGYGFDNIADVLTLSPMLLDKYLRAARQVTDEAFRVSPVVPVRISRSADNATPVKGTPEGPESLKLLEDAAGEVRVTVDAPQDGVYRLAIRAAATQAGDEPTRAQILLDDQPLRELDVTPKWNGRRINWPTTSFLTPIARGQHTIVVKLANPGDRQLAVDRVMLDGPVGPVAPQPSAFLHWLAPDQSFGVPTLSLSGEDLESGSGKGSLDTGSSYFASNGFRHKAFVAPQAGRYRFRIKAGAQQVGDEPVRFEVRLGDKVLASPSVTTKAQAPQWIEFEADVAAGEHDLQVWFTNFIKDEATGAERWLWIHELHIQGPLGGSVGLSREALPELLERVGRRINRRPLADAERDKLMALAGKALDAGQTPTDALRLCTEAMLVSPKFLFRQDTAGGPGESGSAPVDELSLASRLSYFLWSSTPDDTLLSLAERGELRRDLPGQVRRMLADPRASALTENFAGQWLQLRDVPTMARDPEAFPDYSAELAADMRRETELLFAHILGNNRSVLEFLSADYTFANRRLAVLYGIDDPAAATDEFVRVSLKGTPRRGVLTQASILALTSHPTRTSPVKRGKFVLERILGADTPQTPPDVPPLEEAGPDLEKLSLRQRFEAHRSNPACASCHNFLDPIGFAMEHYDAIGRYRQSDGGQPVDASGQLISGERFADMTELNDLLLRQKKEDFVRCLAESLLTYALGREVLYTDRPSVQAICDAAARNDYQFADMIVAVCQSLPFQRMRQADVPAADTSPRGDPP